MGAALVFSGVAGGKQSYEVYERATIRRVLFDSLGKGKGYHVQVIFVDDNATPRNFIVGSNPKTHIAALLEGTGPCTLALKE